MQEGSRAKVQKNAVSFEATCERIRERAAEMGVSNTELAERAGVSERQVYKVLSGAANLRRSTVGKFARALDTSIEYLEYGKEEKAVRERKGFYHAGNAQQDQPLNVESCVKGLSSVLGIPEDEVRKHVADLISRRSSKTGDT